MGVSPMIMRKVRVLLRYNSGMGVSPMITRKMRRRLAC